MGPFKTPDRDIVVANWGAALPQSPPALFFSPAAATGL